MPVAELLAGPALTVGGVDVGGPVKGFHYAVLSGAGLVDSGRADSPDRLATAIASHAPTVVAVDGPRSLAPDGLAGRPCERDFLGEGMCGLRLTPDRATMVARGGENHLAWIGRGLDLYRRLDAGPWQVIECFPTAAWTVWGGARNGRSRARWSAAVLAGFELSGVPARMSQDARDALGAALTALAFARGMHRSFGELVLPA